MIGLHFFLEGTGKLADPKPFSGPFFGNAKGPLAGVYKGLVWDPDGLYRLDEQATIDYWDNYRNRIVAHYGFDDKQKKEANAALQTITNRYKYHLSSKEDEIAEYRLMLARRDDNAKDEVRQLASLQSHDSRIASETRKLYGQIVPPIDKLWRDLETDLNNVATAEQWKPRGHLKIGRIGSGSFDAETMDLLVPYFNVAVGVCLLLGLFTRAGGHRRGGFPGERLRLAMAGHARGGADFLPGGGDVRLAHAGGDWRRALLRTRFLPRQHLLPPEADRRNQMIPLTPEERETGKENFYSAVQAFDQSPAAETWQRRDFSKTAMGIGVAASVPAMTTGCNYFGYSPIGDPVRVAVIGTGDEGSVLIGALNPAYITVVSICDIRPYNVHRAFHGDWAERCGPRGPARPDRQVWLRRREGRQGEDQGRDRLQEGARGSERRRRDHRPAAVLARPGRHRGNEGRQARADRKADGPQRGPVQGDGPAVATKQNKVLTVGHQRHYSVLYDNAVNLIKWGLLGEIHHIRAQWHRGNLPGNDSWQQPLPFDVETWSSTARRTKTELRRREAEGVAGAT